jgi:hypothetical protein
MTFRRNAATLLATLTTLCGCSQQPATPVAHPNNTPLANDNKPASAPALPWLDGYSGQSVDQLIALEGKYRIDSLVVAIAQALKKKAVRARITDEERVICGVEALEQEVNDGGYDQFFFNTPEYVPLIVQSLRRINCPRTAALTQKAINVVQAHSLTAEEFKKRPWAKDAKRSKELEECDKTYSEKPENIETRLFDFIKAHREKIKL